MSVVRGLKLKMLMEQKLNLLYFRFQFSVDSRRSFRWVWARNEKKKTNHIIKIKTKTERNEQKKPKHKNQKVFREFGLNLVRQQTSEFDSSKNYIIVFSLISVQNETEKNLLKNTFLLQTDSPHRTERHKNRNLVLCIFIHKKTLLSQCGFFSLPSHWFTMSALSGLAVDSLSSAK